jgi:hypothetical protein
MRALICFLADAEFAIQNVATVIENSALKGTASFPGSGLECNLHQMLGNAWTCTPEISIRPILKRVE